ncbi:PEP-CTERM sorting domain-containing protein [Duganella sp. HH101]|uniref:PEP-CTERM sorting domain-containing protein n=1 Tax=Duganella sp. HH101 TaxID=1781066 RepID=UPI000892D3DB|nr:PEP-CTERM sorting domain-containing protein [Duganella sp. HH101]OFA04928.1 PEP-CTERM motif protein [Duganella sp. HH101]
MKFKNIAAALCIAASAVSAPAMATTVSYDITSVAAGTKTNILTLLNIKQFDALLGTLTGIEIDYGSHLLGQVAVTNESLKKDKTAVFSLSSTMSLTGPAGLNLGSDSKSLFSASVTAVKNTANVIGKTGTADLSSSTLLSGNTNFSLFTGTGDVGAWLNISALSDVSGQTITNTFTTWANGQGKVTYTYNAAPVPEPETYGMLLLGLGVVAFAAKRKSRAA